MLVIISLIIFYLVFPAVIIYLTKKSSLLEKIGAVVLAYIIGFLLGNVGLLPRFSHEVHAFLAGRASLPREELAGLISQGLLTEAEILPNKIAFVQDLLMTLSIPLAIPLLLFTLDLRSWLSLAKKAMYAMILGVVALTAVVVGGFFLLKDFLPDAWKIAGMLVGIYSGGTPNLAAITAALDVSPDTFILVHTYEMVTGFFLLVFLITIAQSFFNRFLPAFKSNGQADQDADLDQASEDFTGMLTKSSLLQMLKAFALSVLIFALGGGLSLLVPKSAQMVTVILTITTLGLLGSLFRPINKLTKSFSLGMYLILVFSLLVSSMANLSAIFSIDFLHLFFYVGIALVGSAALHVVLCWIFKIDTDTTIITISALSFSPPFVPVVAGALKNREIIISGLTVGILGYAFGTYLGVALAYLLAPFM